MKMPAWLERAAPGSLGVFLGKTASRRKSGLFIRHLCRCFPEVFVDPRSLAALEAADRFEAGEIDEPAYQAVVAAAAEVVTATQPDRSNWQDRAVLSVAVAASIAQEVSARGYYPHVLTNLGRIVGNWGGPRSTARKPLLRAMRLLFLEHFGDTERAVVFDPLWRTEVVVGLTAGIYAERAFDLLPILGDALQDAGCQDEEILAHCYGQGQHVRGCWVVDAILSHYR